MANLLNTRCVRGRVRDRERDYECVCVCVCVWYGRSGCAVWGTECISQDLMHQHKQAGDARRVRVQFVY